jgi:hypothetical protein
MSKLEGEIKAGDAVKTLHLKHAVYGRVDFISKGYAYIKGRTQPGKSLQRVKASVENLDRVTEDELAPEDRKGGETLITVVEPDTAEELQERFNAALDAAGGKQELVSREELARRSEDFRKGLKGE